MQNLFNKLIKHSKDPQFMEEVFEFAKNAYGDKKRSTGEEYIEHAVNVAVILSDMGLDATTVAAGLLHDTANQNISESRNAVLYDIEKKFGQDIANIVSKNAELNKIYYFFNRNANEAVFLQKEKVENARKMLLAIAGDLRVIIIELAARIDGLQKLSSLPQERQRIYALETLEIFVPIANRLGLGEIKRKLEDPTFEFLFPEKFAWLQEHLEEKYEERAKYLKKFIPKFKRILSHEKIKFSDINYRAKSYWSTYQKLERHAMNFEKLHDLVAMRVIVKDVAACYRVLGIIHKHFQPISGQIQDYIAKPKENGYKSLHTTVFLEPGKISEIQIKTEEMHREAEYGICAHWAYKEKLQLQKDIAHLAWSKEVPDFFKDFKIDFFENQIFTFTPKGDVIALPKGSTPIDFAYALHSEIGDHCESAKIGGKIIPLSQSLTNGDVVEIITSEKKKPSYDWLKFVKTSIARSHIRKLTSAIITPIFSVPSFVKSKIFGVPKKPEPAAPIRKPKEVYLAGQKGMMVNFAKCCSPQPEDSIQAYLTRQHAAMVHKTSCKFFQETSRKFPEKIIDASWHQS
ncbi:MAG: hypothetical protein A3A98_03930 [Candidatus Staskawiczbacteria bacterium RIFCSPLOWO2_01_FULL_40_39]|uniref:TGS domain-containing protein n=1 Tax=Candidatus Staskawiczbacteria bacterium RIFCSPHIGHO2_01_FULL_39_25 TaxID=1802202 RepID=A0A1G2HNU2_9BACT|nr:MAG: hypothetical protein A2730_03145 [Candidatus Staskawiczbacteria bacterium RIFCSPHIGHO2_01_FULL_39_25]OGZ73919.1 MAG: hypothetical protein A3A98_03930 [Candidatus Staskawiczbacteria bacterium RIFCSPLOWO2_01_FULL_40_39]OGZ76545.1 MAG: hypothetical protein A3I87_00325 [Candidatus Staskawiczbacteria bacterium RIFCSPLOWO2_02_FULL_39_8]